MGKGCSKSSYQPNHNFEYDLVVIGGGSGGIAAAKEAAEMGKKVCVCDFVTPSPIGTTWGLGGTCVNVGCIPKKLMHQAALLRTAAKDSIAYGWNANDTTLKHNWVGLRDNIEDYIRSLSFGLRVSLNQQNITYHNAFVQFQNKNTLKKIDKKNHEETITASQILIAVGGRPKYLDIPGGRKEDALCISSDDIFSFPEHPGRVLVVGASYIAVECSGFLVGFGVDVTMMIRSAVLRGFDNEMAAKIEEILRDRGVNMMIGWVPSSIEKVANKNPIELRVTATNTKSGDNTVAIYNTIILAVGREPCTTYLNLEEIGVKVNSESKKIIVDKGERTSVSNIYAIGDCAEGRPELTPPAIKAGVLLARRVFGKSTAIVNYNNVASVVFAPLEYGFVGLTEEDAIAKYGEKNIEVYFTNMQPLEFALPGRDKTFCIYKVITLKRNRQPVLGMHYIGPHAGEVIQGFSTAIKLKATKQDLNMTIGIHPTCAEIFLKMRQTKSGGISTLYSDC